MNWSELVDTAKLSDTVIVKLIKPLRKGEYFTEGEMCGYKAGIIGGGWSANKMRFESTKLRFIKKPKVCVTYNIFEMFKKPYMDWVDVDNCEFEIKQL